MAEKALGDAAFQRRVASLLLSQVGPIGFALAGSGAIREHGITDRPTNDVDLFTTTATGPEGFAAAVDAGERVLRDRGFRVTRTRSTTEFARLLVEATDEAGSEVSVEVDFGIDWRKEAPAQLAIGPVLALADAVGSKIAAVYSRGEVRDYLDIDAIRRSGRFTDPQLIALAQEHDPGFDLAMFIHRLNGVAHFGAVETVEYGVDTDQLDEIKTRLTTWADYLAATEPPSTPHQPGFQPLGPHAAPPPPEPPHPGRLRDTGGPSIEL